MRTQILKKRIFLSNALMILLTLAAVALVNLAAVKIRWEFSGTKAYREGDGFR